MFKLQRSDKLEVVYKLFLINRIFKNVKGNSNVMLYYGFYEINDYILKSNCEIMYTWLIQDD